MEYGGIEKRRLATVAAATADAANTAGLEGASDQHKTNFRHKV
jgi:hypothetical protein